MESVLERKKCTGCMACLNICPKEAIEIEIGKDGFNYPKVNKEKCINCGICQKACPVINKIKENTNKIEVYACRNKNEKIRMKSSSGGIFTLMAEWILSHNGVVFGVKFNQNMEAVHDYVEDKENLKMFRGSKYVQSNIGKTYQKIKQFLLEGRKVLFTGTPCQVEGLLAYLGKEYENLYTQDIICHGVPSPKVWEKYLEYKKKIYGEYPKKVDFRRKDLSDWRNYQVCYKYSNIEENIDHIEDVYMKLFLYNFDLRQTCYNCNFKKIKRSSDITIADFWGIQNVNPDFYDERGISAVLVNTEKGRQCFENIKNNIEFSVENIEDIMKYNSSFYKSAKYNEEREKFFEDLENNDFEYLIKKFL